MLPLAIAGMLVVYSLKDTSFISTNLGISEAIALVVLIVVYKWRYHALSAIFADTVLYMLLVRLVFV